MVSEVLELPLNLNLDCGRNVLGHDSEQVQLQQKFTGKGLTSKLPCFFFSYDALKLNDLRVEINYILLRGASNLVGSCGNQRLDIRKQFLHFKIFKIAKQNPPRILLYDGRKEIIGL